MNFANPRRFALLFGAFFLVLGLLTFFTANPKAYNGTTTGTIVDFEQQMGTGSDDTTVITYVDYSVDGVRYTHVPYPSYNFTMDIGDEVKLYFKTSDPSQIAAPGKDLMPFVGLGAAVLGGVVLITSLRGTRKKAEENK